MADSTRISQPDVAVAVKAGKAKKLSKASRPAEVRKTRKAERSMTVIAGQAVVWVACLAVGGASLIPLTQAIQQETSALLLLQADNAEVSRVLATQWPGSPSYLEALSELSLSLPKPDVNSSYSAAERATKADPDRAFAWASLAYLEYGKAKAVNPAALDALTKSMDACPLCSDQLIRWRFNFVLANWNAMPEAVRHRAFEQADLLRWSGVNGEFLAEMRAKANSAGIPYDVYRAAVNTPVRTWDLGPAPQARLANPGQPRRPNA